MGPDFFITGLNGVELQAWHVVIALSVSAAHTLLASITARGRDEWEKRLIGSQSASAVEGTWKAAGHSLQG